MRLLIKKILTVSFLYCLQISTPVSAIEWTGAKPWAIFYSYLLGFDVLSTHGKVLPETIKSPSVLPSIVPQNDRLNSDPVMCAVPEVCVNHAEETFTFKPAVADVFLNDQQKEMLSRQRRSPVDTPRFTAGVKALEDISNEQLAAKLINYEARLQDLLPAFLNPYSDLLGDVLSRGKVVHLDIQVPSTSFKRLKPSYELKLLGGSLSELLAQSGEFVEVPIFYGPLNKFKNFQGSFVEFGLKVILTSDDLGIVFDDALIKVKDQAGNMLIDIREKMLSTIKVMGAQGRVAHLSPTAPQSERGGQNSAQQSSTDWGVRQTSPQAGDAVIDWDNKEFVKMSRKQMTQLMEYMYRHSNIIKDYPAPRIIVATIMTPPDGQVSESGKLRRILTPKPYQNKKVKGSDFELYLEYVPPGSETRNEVSAVRDKQSVAISYTVDKPSVDSDLDFDLLGIDGESEQGESLYAKTDQSPKKPHRTKQTDDLLPGLSWRDYKRLSSELEQQVMVFVERYVREYSVLFEAGTGNQRSVNLHVHAILDTSPSAPDISSSYMTMTSHWPEASQIMTQTGNTDIHFSFQLPGGDADPAASLPDSSLPKSTSTLFPIDITLEVKRVVGVAGQQFADRLLIDTVAYRLVDSPDHANYRPDNTEGRTVLSKGQRFSSAEIDHNAVDTAEDISHGGADVREADVSSESSYYSANSDSANPGNKPVDGAKPSDLEVDAMNKIQKYGQLHTNAIFDRSIERVTTMTVYIPKTPDGLSVWGDPNHFVNIVRPPSYAHKSVPGSDFDMHFFYYDDRFYFDLGDESPLSSPAIKFNKNQLLSFTFRVTKDNAKATRVNVDLIGLDGEKLDRSGPLFVDDAPPLPPKLSKVKAVGELQAASSSASGGRELLPGLSEQRFKQAAKELAPHLKQAINRYISNAVRSYQRLKLGTDNKKALKMHLHTLIGHRVPSDYDRAYIEIHKSVDEDDFARVLNEGADELHATYLFDDDLIHGSNKEQYAVDVELIIDRKPGVVNTPAKLAKKIHISIVGYKIVESPDLIQFAAKKGVPVIPGLEEKQAPVTSQRRGPARNNGVTDTETAVSEGGTSQRYTHDRRPKKKHSTSVHFEIPDSITPEDDAFLDTVFDGQSKDHLGLSDHWTFSKTDDFRPVKVFFVVPVDPEASSRSLNREFQKMSIPSEYTGLDNTRVKFVSYDYLDSNNLISTGEATGYKIYQVQLIRNYKTTEKPVDRSHWKARITIYDCAPNELPDSAFDDVLLSSSTKAKPLSPQQAVTSEQHRQPRPKQRKVPVPLEPIVFNEVQSAEQEQQERQQRHEAKKKERELKKAGQTSAETHHGDKPKKLTRKERLEAKRRSKNNDKPAKVTVDEQPPVLPDDGDLVPGEDAAEALSQVESSETSSQTDGATEQRQDHRSTDDASRRTRTHEPELPIDQEVVVLEPKHKRKPQGSETRKKSGKSRNSAKTVDKNQSSSNQRGGADQHPPSVESAEVEAQLAQADNEPELPPERASRRLESKHARKAKKKLRAEQTPVESNNQPSSNQRVSAAEHSPSVESVEGGAQSAQAGNEPEQPPERASRRLESKHARKAKQKVRLETLFAENSDQVSSNQGGGAAEHLPSVESVEGGAQPAQAGNEAEQPPERTSRRLESKHARKAKQKVRLETLFAESSDQPSSNQRGGAAEPPPSVESVEGGAQPAQAGNEPELPPERAQAGSAVEHPHGGELIASEAQPAPAGNEPELAPERVQTGSAVEHPHGGELIASKAQSAPVGNEPELLPEPDSRRLEGQHARKAKKKVRPERKPTKKKDQLSGRRRGNSEQPSSRQSVGATDGVSETGNTQRQADRAKAAKATANRGEAKRYTNLIEPEELKVLRQIPAVHRQETVELKMDGWTLEQKRNQLEYYKHLPQDKRLQPFERAVFRTLKNDPELGEAIPGNNDIRAMVEETDTFDQAGQQQTQGADVEAPHKPGQKSTAFFEVDDPVDKFLASAEELGVDRGAVQEGADTHVPTSQEKAGDPQHVASKLTDSDHSAPNSGRESIASSPSEGGQKASDADSPETGRSTKVQDKGPRGGLTSADDQASDFVSRLAKVKGVNKVTAADGELLHHADAATGGNNEVIPEADNAGKPDLLEEPTVDPELKDFKDRAKGLHIKVSQSAIEPLTDFENRQFVELKNKMFASGFLDADAFNEYCGLQEKREQLRKQSGKSSSKVRCPRSLKGCALITKLRNIRDMPIEDVLANFDLTKASIYSGKPSLVYRRVFSKFRSAGRNAKHVIKFGSKTTGIVGSNLLPTIGIADVVMGAGEGLLTLYTSDDFQRFFRQGKLSAQFTLTDDILRYGGPFVFLPGVELFIPRNLEGRAAKGYIEEKMSAMVQKVADIDPSFLPDYSSMVPEGPFEVALKPLASYQSAERNLLPSEVFLELPSQMDELARSRKGSVSHTFANGMKLYGVRIREPFSEVKVEGLGDLSEIDKAHYGYDKAGLDRQFFLIVKPVDQDSFEPVAAGSGLTLLNNRKQFLDKQLFEFRKSLALMRRVFEQHVCKEQKMPTYADADAACRAGSGSDTTGLAFLGCTPSKVKRKLQRMRQAKRADEIKCEKMATQIVSFVEGLLEKMFTENVRLTASIGELTADLERGEQEGEESEFVAAMDAIYQSDGIQGLLEEADRQRRETVYDIPLSGSEEANQNRKRLLFEAELASSSLNSLFFQNPKLMKKLFVDLPTGLHCPEPSALKKRLIKFALHVPAQWSRERVQVPSDSHLLLEQSMQWATYLQQELEAHQQGLDIRKINGITDHPGVFQGERVKKVDIQPVKDVFGTFMNATGNAHATDDAMLDKKIEYPGVYTGARLNRMQPGFLQNFLTFSTADAVKSNFEQSDQPDLQEQNKVVYAQVNTKNGHVQQRHEVRSDDFIKTKLCPNKPSAKTLIKSMKKLSKTERKKVFGSALIGKPLPFLLLESESGSANFTKMIPAPVLKQNTRQPDHTEVNFAPFYHYFDGGLHQVSHKGNSTDTIELDKFSIAWPESEPPELFKVSYQEDSELLTKVKAKIRFEKSSKYQKKQVICLRKDFFTYGPNAQFESLGRSDCSLQLWALKIEGAGLVTNLGNHTFPDQKHDRYCNSVHIERPLLKNEYLLYSCTCCSFGKKAIPPRFWSHGSHRIIVSASLAPGVYRLQKGETQHTLLVTSSDWQNQPPVEMPANALPILLRQKKSLWKRLNSGGVRYRRYWRPALELRSKMKSFSSASYNATMHNNSKYKFFLYSKEKSGSHDVTYTPSAYVSTPQAIVKHSKQIKSLMSILNNHAGPKLSEAEFYHVIEEAACLPVKAQKRYVASYLAKRPVSTQANDLSDATAVNDVPAQAGDTPSAGWKSRHLLGETLTDADSPDQSAKNNAGSRVNQESRPIISGLLGAGYLLDQLNKMRGKKGKKDKTDSDHGDGKDKVEPVIDETHFNQWLFALERLQQYRTATEAYEAIYAVVREHHNWQDYVGGAVIEGYHTALSEKVNRTGYSDYYTTTTVKDALLLFGNRPCFYLEACLKEHSTIALNFFTPKDNAASVVLDVAPFDLLNVLYSNPEGSFRRAFDQALKDLEAQRRGQAEESILVSDVIHYMDNNWLMKSVLNASVLVPVNYQKMTVFTGLDAIYRYQKIFGKPELNGIEPCSVATKNIVQELKAKKLLSEKVKNEITISSFFQGKRVKALLSTFYSESLLNKPCEHIEGKGLVDDIAFYRLIEEDFIHCPEYFDKVCEYSFLDCSYYRMNENDCLFIKPPPETLIKELAFALTGKINIADYDLHNAHDVISRWRYGLIALIVKLLNDKELCLLAGEEPKVDIQNKKLLPYFFSGQKHRALTSSDNIDVESTVPALRYIRSSEPIPSYFYQSAPGLLGGEVEIAVDEATKRLLSTP